MPGPLWTPSPERIAAATLTRFIEFVGARGQLAARDYAALYRWSTARPLEFWDAMWDFAGLRGQKGSRAAIDMDRMPGARFFPEATLNFAENVLARQGADPAIVYRPEAGASRTLSWDELRGDVAACAAALRAQGIRAGDRVAAYLPNTPEAIVGVLGAASVGAVWSSCSPDFGVPGVLDRFGQIQPRVLFCADGYRYNGQTHDSLERVREIAERLPSVRKVVVVPYLDPDVDVSDIPKAVRLDEWLRRHQPGDIAYAQLPFNHPLFVLFTSGTTGKPKCIVHGAGGTLLQSLKTFKFHFDARPGDRYFYFCTTNWVVWNVLFTGLCTEAALMLYDGSPFARNGKILFDFAEKEKFTHFGTSAKFLDAASKRGLRPKDTHDLASLRMIISTGSPLAAESFDYVYKSIKQDVCLSSISGGTDIMGAFVDASPVLPVYRGELQCRSLGMAVEVFDETGESVTNQKGELVCTKPFPSMPLGFWNDRGGERYHNAYFAKYPNVWCHGDWCELTERGTMLVYGRSDATLNPGGVRIGTAEIYGVVERIDEVEESVAIGQHWPPDNPTDTRIVLFVKLRAGYELDDALADRIRHEVRRHASPRHVPARIVQVADIPRTKNGKVVELAVKAAVHGMPVPHTDALANPEALELFRDLEELAT